MNIDVVLTKQALSSEKLGCLVIVEIMEFLGIKGGREIKENETEIDIN